MRKRMDGKLATGQCDGWKNVARASVVATMVTAEGEVSLQFLMSYSSLNFLQCVNQAVEVVKWFNNHSRALGLLQVEQEITYHKVLALILPVITRWTAHYLSSRRLLEVSTAVRACGLRHKETLLLCAGNKADAKAKARSIIATTQDDVF
jgi:hypothetical protein